MDGVFEKNNMTDFEKLLFAQRALKDQNALIQEQKEFISKLQVELGKYKASVQELESRQKATKEETKEFRANAYYNSILQENKGLRVKNKKLVGDNKNLIYQLRHK